MTIHIAQKAQIRWQCRRGMLELDILLLAFFDMYYDKLNTKAQELFVKLLEATDPELYSWLLGESVPPDDLQRIVTRIRESNSCG